MWAITGAQRWLSAFMTRKSNPVIAINNSTLITQGLRCAFIQTEKAANSL